MPKYSLDRELQTVKSDGSDFARSQAERVARLEATIEVLLSNRTDQEARLRKLERLGWLSIGAATLAGVLGSDVAARLLGG